MDDKRFDELSRFLGGTVSRQGIFKLLAGLGAAGASVLGGAELLEAKKGKGKDKKDNDKNKDRDDDASAEGKNGKKSKGKNKRKKKAAQQGEPKGQKTCADQGKIAFCHCPPGNPENSHVICSAESSCSGHVNQCDCICGTAPAGCKVPACAPGRCEGSIKAPSALLH